VNDDGVLRGNMKGFIDFDAFRKQHAAVTCCNLLTYFTAHELLPKSRDFEEKWKGRREVTLRSRLMSAFSCEC
jgi:hypothetical protein